MRSRLLLLATVPLLMAGRRRQEPMPDPPPVPVAAALPTVSTTPLDASVPVPPLEGDTTALDLEALMHSTVVFTLTVDTSSLDLVTADSQPAFLRQLAADPTWRLTRLDGATVALKREEQGKAWVVGRTGFHDDRVSTRRTLLRFDPWPAEHEWATSRLASRVDASSSKKKVTAFTMQAEPWRGRVATALSIQGEGMALEIFEAGDEDDRSATVDALGNLPVWTQGLASRLSEIEARGYDRLHLPPGEPTHEHPWVELSSPERGQLDLRGRHNPGADGWLWARILDEELHPWEEEAVAVGTLERVGGSPDESESFYFQGAFPVPGGSSFSGTIELWFQADGGSPHRLGAFPVKVPRR